MIRIFLCLGLLGVGSMAFADCPVSVRVSGDVNLDGGGCYFDYKNAIELLDKKCQEEIESKYYDNGSFGVKVLPFRKNAEKCLVEVTSFCEC